jgi:hypothetical protein
LASRELCSFSRLTLLHEAKKVTCDIPFCYDCIIYRIWYKFCTLYKVKDYLVTCDFLNYKEWPAIRVPWVMGIKLEVITTPNVVYALKYYCFSTCSSLTYWCICFRYLHDFKNSVALKIKVCCLLQSTASTSCNQKMRCFIKIKVTG